MVSEKTGRWQSSRFEVTTDYSNSTILAYFSCRTTALTNFFGEIVFLGGTMVNEVLSSKSSTNTANFPFYRGRLDICHSKS